MPECSFSQLYCLVFCDSLTDVILGQFSVITVSNISSVPFLFSLWNSHYAYVKPFVAVPQFLNILLLFFSSFFSFLSERFRDSFLSQQQSNLLSPSNGYSVSLLHCYNVFYLQHFFLVLSQNFYLSSNIVHLFLHAVYLIHYSPQHFHQLF